MQKCAPCQFGLWSLSLIHIATYLDARHTTGCYRSNFFQATEWLMSLRVNLHLHVEDDTYMYFLLMELMNSSQFRKLHSHDVVFCKEIARNEYLSLSIIKNSRSNEWIWYHITVFPTSIQADHTNHNVNVTTMRLFHFIHCIWFFTLITYTYKDVSVWRFNLNNWIRDCVDCKEVLVHTIRHKIEIFEGYSTRPLFTWGHQWLLLSSSLGTSRLRPLMGALSN